MSSVIVFCRTRQEVYTKKYSLKNQSLLETRIDEEIYQENSYLSTQVF